MNKRGYKTTTKKSQARKLPEIFCVGRGKTWRFSNVHEAAKVMGMKVPEIYKEMKHNGKNRSNRRWYYKSGYTRYLKGLKK